MAGIRWDLVYKDRGEKRFKFKHTDAHGMRDTGSGGVIEVVLGEVFAVVMHVVCGSDFFVRGRIAQLEKTRAGVLVSPTNHRS